MWHCFDTRSLTNNREHPFSLCPFFLILLQFITKNDTIHIKCIYTFIVISVSWVVSKVPWFLVQSLETNFSLVFLFLKMTANQNPYLSSQVSFMIFSRFIRRYRNSSIENRRQITEKSNKVTIFVLLYCYSISKCTPILGNFFGHFRIQIPDLETKVSHHVTSLCCWESL
jgi:hypothetical protein